MIIKIYVQRILDGAITIDDVPKAIRKKVEEALAEL